MMLIMFYICKNNAMLQEHPIKDWYATLHRKWKPSMLEYSMMDCMFSRYIYPANGS